jgi:ABC-type nitrate/sulfonate/bicarbonate transport system permease component
MRRRRWAAALVYLRTMALFVLAWALIAWLKGNTVLLPSPLAVIGAIVELARDLELFEHAGISLARLLASLALATALAIPLGIAMGLHPLFDRIVDPTMEMLRPISGIAWIPLASSSSASATLSRCSS